MKKINRRSFIKSSLITSTIGLTASTAFSADATPPEIEGPFYPKFAQKDKDFDLTKVDGKKDIAKGKVVIIQGKVMDTNGKIIEDATVDLWQANAAGRYRHPHDTNKAPLDPNFQGWAIVLSGKDGGFKFKTIIPGSYPASKTWNRPPHIHFKVSKKGYAEITTQMYFPGHKLNESDLLLKQKNKSDRKQMIASKLKNDTETYSYHIILKKV